MYRYQKMVKEYIKMKEFIGYELDYTMAKGFYFEVKTENDLYAISLTNGAFGLPKIRRVRQEDKLMEKRAIEEVYPEVMRVFVKIIEVMKEANQPYEMILPGYCYQRESLALHVDLLVEDMPEHRKKPYNYPDELRIWANICEGEVCVFEMNLTLVNTSVNEHFPIWEVKDTNLKGTRKEIKKIAQFYIEQTKNQLNKKHRIRKMFAKEVRD